MTIQGANPKIEVVLHAKITIPQKKNRHEEARRLVGGHCRADDQLPEEGRRLKDHLYLEEGLDRQTIVTRALIGNL